MGSKQKHRPHAASKRDKLAIGNVVASPDGALKGAGPFTSLIVTAVHKDGRVDLEGLDGTGTWKGVRPASIVKVADTVG